MEHTEECNKKAEQSRLEIEAWKAKWPDHCPDCGGHGGETYAERHPYGSTYAIEYIFEPCECTYEKCPRCGKAGLTSEERGDENTGEGPCRFCGWNYDDGIPEPYVCWTDCMECEKPVPSGMWESMNRINEEENDRLEEEERKKIRKGGQ